MYFCMGTGWKTFKLSHLNGFESCVSIPSSVVVTALSYCTLVHAAPCARCRERAVELEALACARLGQLNARVLKDGRRATEYYRRCLELAQALHPIPYWKSWHRVRTRACTSRTPSTLAAASCLPAMLASHLHAMMSRRSGVPAGSCVPEQHCCGHEMTEVKGPFARHVLHARFGSGVRCTHLHKQLRAGGPN
jgi:hypothetical protein